MAGLVAGVYFYAQRAACGLLGELEERVVRAASEAELGIDSDEHIHPTVVGAERHGGGLRKDVARRDLCESNRSVPAVSDCTVASHGCLQKSLGRLVAMILASERKDFRKDAQAAQSKTPQRCS